MKKWHIHRFISLLLIMLFVQTSALADVASSALPKPDKFSYVFDFADVISARDESLISTYCADLSNVTGATIVTITINSLDGTPIRDFTFDTINAWGIGDKDRMDGVLLALSVEDRAIAIEVGTGLDRLLDKSTCDDVIELCVDSLSKNDYSTGVKELAIATCLTLLKKQTIFFDDPDMVKAVADI